MMNISLVVPVFNEEDAIPIFYKKVREFEGITQHSVEIVFVNDGSVDSTEFIINSIATNDDKVKALNLTRNFGKEAALFAGLDNVTGDAIIPIDVDLQDPIEVIPDLIEKWMSGYEVVLAKRVDRSTDGRLKRKSAELFYKLHNKISKPIIEENVGDFRLMSREVVENIKQMPETGLFMKGILSWVGGKCAVIEYSREKRIAGNSKFNGWKLWNLALDGITSFSTFPLRIWSYLGFFIATIAFFYGAWMIIDTLIWGNSVQGYPSLLACILFLGGVQLIGVGILGEYVGRILLESKRRPRYLIKKETTNDKGN